jgi:hypothetical protein
MMDFGKNWKEPMEFVGIQIPFLGEWQQPRAEYNFPNASNKKVQNATPPNPLNENPVLIICVLFRQKFPTQFFGIVKGQQCLMHSTFYFYSALHKIKCSIEIVRNLIWCSDE